MTMTTMTPDHARPSRARRAAAPEPTAPRRCAPTARQMLQVVLFVGGAVLLPLGLVVIVLGWYGASNTPYQYDQLSYLVSGGLLGLGLTFCGGFLYFGAWLARIAADQKETSKRLSDTLLVLADVVVALRGHVAGRAAGRSAVAARPRLGARRRRHGQHRAPRGLPAHRRP